MEELARLDRMKQPAFVHDGALFKVPNWKRPLLQHDDEAEAIWAAVKDAVIWWSCPPRLPKGARMLGYKFGEAIARYTSAVRTPQRWHKVFLGLSQIVMDVPTTEDPTDVIGPLTTPPWEEFAELAERPDAGPSGS